MAEILVEQRGAAAVAAPAYGTGYGATGGPRARVSWGAIFAGLVVATVVQVVLALLGLAIGLAAFDPGTSAKGAGIGTGLWVIVSALVALFVGGLTTGRLAGVMERRDGFLHGVVLWGLSTLLGVWLLSRGLGALFGGAFNLAGNVLGGAARAATSVAGAAVNASTAGGTDANLDFADVRGELERTLRQTGDPTLSPDSLGAAAKAAGGAAPGGAGNAQAADEIGTLLREKAGNVDRNDVLNVITRRTNLSRADAERLADRVTSGAQDVRSRATQAVAEVKAEAPAKAEAAASAASGGTWLALLALGLTLAAAAFGATRTARE
jgi:hypothetical protein